jgi:hypothetical protein
MPRANRHYVPGCVWHITHRCHKTEFLLKFTRERRRWLQWLFEAKKRYGLSFLMSPESLAAYKGILGDENTGLRLENTHSWDDIL